MRMSKRVVLVIALLVAFSVSLPAQSGHRPLKLDDLARMHEISDPQISPDGKWVAYVVSTVDVKEDKTGTDIWMVSFDGTTDRQMTSSPDNESSPRWSPDGRYLSFTSSRPGPTRGNQVWLLDREGGEAKQLTDIKGRVQGYEWSPDSTRLAVVVGDPDPEAEPSGASAEGGRPRVPKPIVIDRYGTDQYIIQYDYEIGPPWNAQAWETYQKISYPFLHADRIKTPTLFLGGERDFNVPVQGGQQMYQALRSLGVETQLVIYPNENHGISRPSYVRDRLERYLAWYDKYLKKAQTTSPESRVECRIPA
jgi:dipeptidyl aminopeptidase/acylaminoacyl peptidase